MKKRKLKMFMIILDTDDSNRLDDFHSKVRFHFEHWWHYIHNVWIVITDYSASTLASFASNHASRTLVNEITDPDEKKLNGWLPQKAWAFIDREFNNMNELQRGDRIRYKLFDTSVKLESGSLKDAVDAMDSWYDSIGGPKDKSVEMMDRALCRNRAVEKYIEFQKAAWDALYG